MMLALTLILLGTLMMYGGVKGYSVQKLLLGKQESTK